MLRYWRRQRGLSQLDLALAADVSARHVSFLETGRSRPSPEMVVQLGATLGLSLRHVDAMLRAAGHEPRHGQEDDRLPPAAVEALGLMKAHHEPYPLLVIDRTYRVVDVNRGAAALLAAIVGPDAAEAPNHARLTFDPAGAHPHIVNVDEVGRTLLWRIQRELLDDPDDDDLRDLLDELLAMPTVDPAWRQVDLAVPSEPALVLHLRVGDVELRFLTMVTAFQAPQNVAVEAVRIETWFPADTATAAVCRVLAGAPETTPNPVSRRAAGCSPRPTC
jgi:transcriptional regulator with XRE-family HTH domain